MEFTRRELQILDLLQNGMTNKEIAQRLGISPHTVRDYISGMLMRHSLPGRAALAVMHHIHSTSDFAPITPADPTNVGLHL